MGIKIGKKIIRYEASEVLTNVYCIFQMDENHDKLFLCLHSVVLPYENFSYADICSGLFHCVI